MKRRAFTLVELLVVIAIIALLIAVLLPALQKARDSALSVQCMSNMRACGQTFFIYANLNKGYLPQSNFGSIENLPGVGTISGFTGANPNGIFYNDSANALNRIVNPKSEDGRITVGAAPGFAPNPAWSPGNMSIFYCPANYLWDNDTKGSGSSHWPEDLFGAGKIKYWYMGDPNPYYPLYHYTGGYSQASGSYGAPLVADNTKLDWRIWDRNNNGDNRDDYIVKLGDKGATNICIMTDHMRQNALSGGSGAAWVYGFSFIHGKGRQPMQGWKNNLFGDGHVESRHAKVTSFAPGGNLFLYNNQYPSDDEIRPGWGGSASNLVPAMW